MKEGIGIGIHICGNATAIAEDMVETGALYFEPDQKIDRERVRRMTDGPVTLSDTIDPSRILCRGNIEEVEEVKEDIRLLGRAGRYVLSPGCSLPCSTPFENVRALIETGRQYGEYGKDGQLVRIPAR